MSQPDGADEAFLDRPNVARMWDYFLGGYHNFAVDREAAERAIELYPDMPLVAQTTRNFLRKTMRFLLDQGVDQFLDLGSGIPTVGNVHEVVQAVNPAARVVYVDVDPIVIAHSSAILGGTAHTLALQADVRHPEQIIEHPEVRRALDWTRPLGIVAIALFHFISDDAEVLHIVDVLRKSLPPGSYIVITHATADSVSALVAEEGEHNYQRANLPLHFRSHDQVARFFEGLDLVPPGVVYLPLWRPDVDDNPVLAKQPERSANYGGVGLKR